MKDLEPLPFEQLLPQSGPGIVKVPWCARTGGVVVCYPRVFRYMRADCSFPWWVRLLRAWWWVQRASRNTIACVRRSDR